MNKKQWNVMIGSAVVIMSFFIYLDSNHGFLFGDICDSPFRDTAFERLQSGEITQEEYHQIQQLDEFDVVCFVNGEIYEPFIWLFAMLIIVFNILSYLDTTRLR